MHMIGHYHRCQHFQRITFPFIELRQTAEHPTYTASESIEPDKSRFGTLTFECAKQRITPLYG